MQSFYSSPEAKKEIIDLYFSKLDSLPIIYNSLVVETSFGDTNIILTGKEGNLPLILLHGANGCAPIAIEAFLDLVDDFRIYAIDVPGQPNLSAENRLEMKDDSYGKWLYEILTRLNVWEAILVGISFGGFISWKALTFDARRITSTFLLMPAGIINGDPLTTLLKIFLPMKLYKWQQKKKFLHQLLAQIFTEEDKFAEAYLAKVFLHFEIDYSPIPLITNEAAQNIHTPLHLIAAEYDLFFPGLKMLKRAKSIFPTLKTTLLLKNSKHVTNHLGNQLIMECIRKYALDRSEILG